MSEGTASAKRILRLPVRDSMTPDPLLLHRVDASQLGCRDGVSVGGCCTHDCNQGRDCPRADDRGMEMLAGYIVMVCVCLLAVAGWAVWRVA